MTQNNSNLSKERRVEISKYMSYTLRHNPEDVNGLDSEGFANIKDLVLALETEKNFDVSHEDIEQVVEEDDEDRYRIKDDMVKATSGHSEGVKGSADSLDGELPDTLYHASARQNASDIMSEGLQPMTRKKVHLAEDKSKAIQKGERHSKEVVVFIVDVGRMEEDNLNVDNTGGGVYVTEEVPPEYITTNDRIK